MKRIMLMLLLFPFCIALKAQDDTSSAGDTVTAAEMSEYHYGNTAKGNEVNFKVKREKIVYHRVFLVNTAEDDDEVYERALGFARMMDVNHKANKSKKSITIPVSWSYRGGPNECVEALQYQGTLLVEVKDVKTRITLKDITYAHHDRDDDALKPVAKSDFFSKRPDCAPASGKVELLFNCTGCQVSLKAVESQLESQFDSFATQYQEKLKKY